MNKIKTEGLKRWIKSLKKEDFEDNKIIVSGYSIDDYNRFDEVRDKCLINELIDYGDYLIVDLEGYLVLGKWTRRKYKLSSGRIVPIKIVEKLKRNDVGSVNGCWIVPDRFKLKI